MRLSPHEIDCLKITQVGFLAQKRLARGLRLNYVEAVGLIAHQLMELIRDGYSVSRLMQLGKEMLGYRHVLPGVAQLVCEVQVEGTFRDGTKLVTVHDPICTEDGDLELALYGSFLPTTKPQSIARLHSDPPANLGTSFAEKSENFHPGEVSLCTSKVLPGEKEDPVPPGYIPLNAGRQEIELTVVSYCDRPIQVGSHYNFIETNRQLEFDRTKALGMRLNIPAGTSVRFEPGQTRKVTLVEIGGRKQTYGGNFLVNGPANESRLPEIMDRVLAGGFRHKPEACNVGTSTAIMHKSLYLHTYGPTCGDKIRLGDSSLKIRVERDLCVYGEECKFGGGKVLREGMGQVSNSFGHAAADTIITNALIVDAITGIVKADIGIKDGCISGIGKGGNPDTMEGVCNGIIVGAETEVIGGEGLIITAGAIDAHVHFICPEICTEALASGITTLIGGGTGPSSGTRATTCTPGPFHIQSMMVATDGIPLNIGFTGKGNSSAVGGLARDLLEQVEAGAIGLKLHEDWGCTPAAIDSCIDVAEKYDVQVTIHTDSLNESGCVEDTMRAIRGRTIHAYHTEGAGGGHAPDILKICGEPHVLPSSTNPTMPYTVNTVEEHVDMLTVCHHLDPNLKEDIAFAESRIRKETIQAEDVLHDLGAIALMSSDAQAMGRVGEVISRTWQTASKMKEERGRLVDDSGGGEAGNTSAKDDDDDNFRVKRFIAKYTINPAIVHGMSKLIGSVEVGKVADLVLWHPAFFGAKPEMVLKSGQIVNAQIGLANASIPTPQPVWMRKMYGACKSAIRQNSILFVSKYAKRFDRLQSLKLTKRIEAVSNCRGLTKSSLILNTALPRLSVDPETYEVLLEEDRAPLPPSADLVDTGTNKMSDKKNGHISMGAGVVARTDDSVETTPGSASPLVDGDEVVQRPDISAIKAEPDGSEPQGKRIKLTCQASTEVCLARRYFLY